MISRFQAGMKKRSCCSGVAWVRRVGRNMPRWRSRGSGRPRWTKLWRIVMGWEREGNVMGGKQAWGFMVEIQEETKRKKKWFMCHSEFSKCILESQSTVLFTGLSNKKLHSLWNKHAAAHFFVIMQKVHLQHSPIFDALLLSKKKGWIQTKIWTRPSGLNTRASLSSMGWGTQLRMFQIVGDVIWLNAVCFHPNIGIPSSFFLLAMFWR